MFDIFLPQERIINKPNSTSRDHAFLIEDPDEELGVRKVTFGEIIDEGNNLSSNRERKKLFENYLIKASQYVRKEMKNVQSYLGKIIIKSDPLELLSQLNLWSNLADSTSITPNPNLTEIILYRHLIGLCLKRKLTKRFASKGIALDPRDFMSLYEDYHTFYLEYLSFSEFKRKSTGQLELQYQIKLESLHNHINPPLYPHQLKDLLIGLFPKNKYDEYYLKKYGFTIDDSITFGKEIKELIERKFNAGLQGAKMIRKDIEIKNSKELGRDFKLRRDQSKGVDLYILSTELPAKYLFLFKVDEFGKVGNEEVRFRNYLKYFSCKFGDQNSRYQYPLDNNIFYLKPLIRINTDVYFCPLPQDLIDHLYLFHNKILLSEVANKTLIGMQYKDSKAKFLENKVYEYLLRIFPKSKIYRNLHFTNPKGEIDLLVVYGDYIIIVEAKSGTFSFKARTGSKQHIINEINELYIKSSLQFKKATEYITTQKKAIFYSSEKLNINEKLLTIKFNINKTKILKLNITQENLSGLAISPSQVDEIGLEIKKAFDLSVNIFDLDIITRHLTLPSIFIDYIEKRSDALKESILYSINELDFLAFYLINGRFSPPMLKDGSKLDNYDIQETGKNLFDSYYLKNKKAKRLKYSEAFLDLISKFEKGKTINHTATNFLLNLDYLGRKTLETQINRANNLTKQNHDFNGFCIVRNGIGIYYVAVSDDITLSWHLVKGSLLWMQKYKIQKMLALAHSVNTATNQSAVLDFSSIDNSIAMKIIDELDRKISSSENSM